jgi:hypothetical protein
MNEPSRSASAGTAEPRPHPPQRPAFGFSVGRDDLGHFFRLFAALRRGDAAARDHRHLVDLRRDHGWLSGNPLAQELARTAASSGSRQTEKASIPGRARMPAVRRIVRAGSGDLPYVRRRTDPAGPITMMKRGRLITPKRRPLFTQTLPGSLRCVCGSFPCRNDRSARPSERG